ncbi:asparaginase [Kushneria marisflavi]|uniref:L-asparaginase n=1 Tax=Kushneria marisflavi TaxID=157779 RepID=A0A240UP95_9GAMM|nr:asparaginase [Kushneria marisflavi]ART63337.1 L-asparaginase [Kushneria marisflavi]RKD84378.1 L-asparaginase [Kushneria marisflavi]
MTHSLSGKARRIVVLGTGGTIAGSSSQAGANLGYTAGTVSVEDLLGGIAAPDGFTLHAEQVAQLDSKDMDTATWQSLHERCQHWLAQDDVTGLVITHGTDTVEETAFFLHSVLPASKPVVLACAMRPSTALMPDGPQNLRDALAVVATPEAAGVTVVCAGEIHGAIEVSKTHPYRLKAFGSGDSGPIGYVEEASVRQLRAWPHQAAGESLTPPGADQWPRVEIVLSHAGANGALIDLLVRERQSGAADAVAGLVLGATGNASLHRELEQAAHRAQAAGIEVRVAARCNEGRLLPTSDAAFPIMAALSPVKARIALMLELCRD